jgi:aminopeptidase 2
LLNDEGALAHSGQENVSSYLNLVGAMNLDPERALIESYLPELDSIKDYLLTDADRASFRDWVRSNFTPMFNKVSWSAAPGETEDVKTARGHLIRIMGEIGGDPEIIQHSVELAEQYIKDPHAIDPSMAREVLLVAAGSNNPQLFSQYLQAISSPAATPEEIDNFALALANFTDFKLTQQWLQKIVAPETRSQDAPFYIGAVLDNVAVQKPAWEWVKQHWPDVQKKLPAGIFSGGFARAAASFCDTQMRDDVQQFFTEEKLAGTGRALGQAVERINACIDFRSRQQNNLAAWLQQHPASAASGNR